MRACYTGSCGTLCHQRSARLEHLPCPSQPTVLRRHGQLTTGGATSRRVDSHATAGSTTREPNYDSASFRRHSGSTASTSSVTDVSDKAQTQSRMEEIKEFLRAELDRIFSGGVSFAPASAVPASGFHGQFLIVCTCAVSQPGAICC